MTELEFPHLAEVTNNMDLALLAYVRKNLETFSIEVRIDYERWVQYCAEYESWIDSSSQANINYKKETQNAI